ncbi:MAG: PAS domain S-box protein [Anaerolineae bacterium]
MGDTAILIVEDEAIVARDLRQRLRDMGYNVVGIASRGEEAIEKAQTLHPDLTLMDIHLASEMDGIQAATVIRQTCHIPVIFLTAYADEGTLSRAKITEPFGYILKPFEERELQTTIEIGLYRHRSEITMRESEKRYRNLVDNSTGLISTHDMEGRLLSVNPAGARALGYEAAEVIGRNMREFITPRLQGTFGPYLEEIRAKGSAEGKIYIVTRQGDERTWFFRNVLLEEDGKPYVQGYAQDITELQRAERALAEERNLLRMLMDSTPDTIYFKDRESRFLRVNRAMVERFHVERPEDMIGKSDFDFFTREHAQPAYDDEQQILRTGQPIIAKEERETWEDGSVSWVSSTKLPLINPKGEIVGTCGITRDTTERHLVEESVRRQNEYLTALHETTLGLMRRLDVQELLHEILRRAAKLVGTEHGYIFVHEPGQTEIEMRVGTGVYASRVGTRGRFGAGLAGTVWQTGEPVVVADYRKWQGRLPDPSRDVLRAVAGVPLKSGEQFIGVIGLAYTDEGRKFSPEELDALNRFAELASLALDNARLYEAAQRELAERKRAEEETRQAQEFLSQIVENIPHTIYVKDARDLRFVRWNRAGEELMGMSRAHMIGKTDHDLHPEAEVVHVDAKDHETLASGKMLDIPEETIETPQKGRRTMHTKKIPIMDEDGKPVYLLGISEDITEYKKADEQRQALERKLLETQKLESLGVLAGGIAHDFNNLLVSVLGNVGLVLLDLEPTSPVRESIEQIKIAAQRAADLTKQMLAYSGKGKFVMQSVNLNTLIQEMTQLLRVSISKNASLKFNMAKDLPLVEVDATQIRQIMMNLIVNASDAIGAKPGVITISTGSLFADRQYLSETFMAPELKEGSYIFLEVADTGVGMDAETQKKIFDPFFTTKFTGRGLGLAAVLGILRGHEGAIKVYSEVGQGTVFRLLLPCKDQLAAAPLQEPKSFKHGKGTILVVDDEEVVRMVTKRMLERFGYTPLIAEDGFAGLEMLKQHKNEVDCVLLDMTMPRMSGEETYKEIMKLKPDAKVVLMSGYTEMEANRRFKGEGLAGFMQKPYTPEDLQERLSTALNPK